jgi:hypothetical protein
MAARTQTQISGKLIIIGILAVGLVAAGASWWFRYVATHRAAQFWGPEGVRLIRDAPTVYLIKLATAEQPHGLVGPTGVAYEISKARGLLHLRNALLEDRSFDWTNLGAKPTGKDTFLGQWELLFLDDGPKAQLNILFTADCRHASVRADDVDPNWTISTEPISGGLCDIFNEFWSAAESSR